MINPKDIHSISFNYKTQEVEYLSSNGYIMFRKNSTLQQATQIINQWLQLKTKENK